MDTRYLLQDAQGAYHPINGPTTIGRDPTCQIRLSDQEVSRVHALLWMDSRNLYLRDEHTKNGTYLNEGRIPPNQPIAVSVGSQVRVGQTVLTVVSLQPQAVTGQPPVAVQKPVAAPRRSNQPLFILGFLAVGLCLGALALLAGFLLFRSRTPQTTSPDFPGLTVVATSQPQPLLTPQEYADANNYLALSVARLNTAELVFVRQAGVFSSDPQKLDEALREVAAQAMNVALLAEKQGYNAASQGGSNAEQYYSMARLGYALVLESQNLRRGLQNQTATHLQARQIVARYGLRLWNPQVTDPTSQGNPFGPYSTEPSPPPPVQFLKDTSVRQLKKQLGPGAQIQGWLATSAETETLKIDLPALGKPFAQPSDLALLQSLTQASAQADSDRAQQVAAAKLAMLLPMTGQMPITDTPFSLQIMVFSGVAFADGSQIEAGKVPTFAKGQASALAKQGSAGNEFVENVYTLTGDTPPIQTENTPVKATQPVVTLQISGAKQTGRMKTAQGDLGRFDVQLTWQSTFTSSMLDLGCLGGTTQRATGPSGTVNVTAAAYIDPQTNQASISCRVSRPADFVEHLAYYTLQVTVTDGQNVELVPPPPTITDTPPPTITLTPPPSATPTLNATALALGTEVAAQKTAEFQGTLTAIAAQTEQATQASVFTMNGTFGLSHPDDPCNLGPYSSGTLQITVNFGTGAANGTLTGGGSSTRAGLVCGALKFDVTCNASYTGSFSGGVDPASGGLSLAGNVSGNQTCTFTNCSQDGVEFACSPGASSIADSLTITGTVIQASGTGNGAITTCAGCTGNWSAGK